MGDDADERMRDNEEQLRLLMIRARSYYSAGVVIEIGDPKRRRLRSPS